MIRRFWMFLLVCALAGPLHAATIEEADDAYSSRNWEEAAALYEQARGDLEGEAYHRAVYRQGEALRRAEQYEAAAPLLRQTLETDEVDGSTRLDASRRLAISLREIGQAEEAVEALRYALALDLEPSTNTRFADTAMTAGDILAFELERYDEAIEMYRKVERTHEYVNRGPGWGRISDAGGRISYAEALRDDPTAFWMGPYTTHVHDTRAHVYWVSSIDDPPGTLTLTGGDGAGEFTAEVEPLRHAPEWALQVVRLEGLAPRTQYEYEIECAAEREQGRFRTAPVPGSREPIRFTVYGDTQDRPEFHREVAPVMADDDPDFILHTGDMVGSGAYFPHWKSQFFDPATPAVRNSVLWPTVGNHDGHQYYDAFFRGGGELYHSFTYGNIEVFIVASYRGGGTGSARREAQLEWIDEALANSDADWTFAVTHYPMISTGTAHWVNWGQEDFHPIFERHGLDFVLTGHEHIYRRFLPIAGEDDGHAIFHITSGGGASVLGDHGHDGEGASYAPSPLTPHAARALHYLHFEIEGEQLTMEARLRDGTILERVELTKSDGRHDDAVLADAMSLDTALDKVRAYVALQPGTGRRDYRIAPARFELAEGSPEPTYTVTFEHTFPKEAGHMRIEPADDSAWSFEPATFAGGETIAFEAVASEAIDSARDLPMEVDLTLVSERPGIVTERFHVRVVGE